MPSSEKKTQAARTMPYGLLNDIFFKIVFGTQKGVPVLRALLNALLGYSGEQKITELRLVDPAFDKNHFQDKGVILDVRAVDAQGHHYNVEVQLEGGFRRSYIQRSLYYAASLFCGQIQRGDDYKNLRKTIAISLLDFVLFPESDKLHSTFHFREAGEPPFLLSDIFEVHYIELKKFNSAKPHHLRTAFEKWLHVLKFSDLYLSLGTPLPDTLEQEEGIRMAIDSFREAYSDEAIRSEALRRMISEMDKKTMLRDAREEGLEIGREEGLEIGREEGLEIGREEGRREVAREVALRMLGLGLELAVIAQTTGLSEPELDSLKERQTP